MKRRNIVIAKVAGQTGRFGKKSIYSQIHYTPSLAYWPSVQYTVITADQLVSDSEGGRGGKILIILE